MGNPDKIVIFNDREVYTIKGIDYSDTGEAFDKALSMYRMSAKQAVDYLTKARDEEPESVDLDFDIGGFWEIKTIRVF